MEKVTVIIPTYNRANMLENAIKSVLNQTYKNIEIIVVDDNANNEAARKMTLLLEQKYPNVCFIKNEKNLGGALSRNVGIDKSTGEFIAFLDDDDIFHNDKIEKQLKLLKEKEKLNVKVGMVYCYKNQYYDDGKNNPSPKIDVEGHCLFEHMLNKMETTSTWLCPKKVLLEVGKFENVKAHQDNILLMKILANGYEIFRVPEILLDFYIHNGSGITKKNKDYIEYTKNLFEFKKQYYSFLSKEQIEAVEYQNSSMLIWLYKENKMMDEYKKELKKVIKNNNFRMHTLKMLIYYFQIKIK